MLIGINLRETRGKQAKAKFNTSPPTAAKRSSRKPAKESTPQVRRRIPRQLTPLETTQVNDTSLLPLWCKTNLPFSNPTQTLIKRDQNKSIQRYLTNFRNVRVVDFTRSLGLFPEIFGGGGYDPLGRRYSKACKSYFYSYL